MNRAYRTGQTYDRRPVITREENKARVNMALMLLLSFGTGCGIAALAN